MIVLAIDPGTNYSAYVLYDNEAVLEKRILQSGKIHNQDFLKVMAKPKFKYDYLAIEMMKSFGMAVGDEILMTCVWIGRIIEVSRAKLFNRQEFIYRKEVVSRLCRDSRANDKAVRQALIDLYGGKTKAIGTKANPGPLKSIVRDMWSALAIAITWCEKYKDNDMEMFE